MLPRPLVSDFLLLLLLLKVPTAPKLLHTSRTAPLQGPQCKLLLVSAATRLMRRHAQMQHSPAPAIPGHVQHGAHCRATHHCVRLQLARLTAMPRGLVPAHSSRPPLNSTGPIVSLRSHCTDSLAA